MDAKLTSGEHPIVSSDGRSLLVTRGKPATLVMYELDSGRTKEIHAPVDLAKPVGFIQSRYLVYMGNTTPGAAQGFTTHTSRAPRPLLSLKIFDLQTRQFASLLPLIDPRTEITMHY
ncbi:hypothetical protein WT83_04945 [Burkholderia territorii]|uniref:Uncharacterized protein n=1 Tax=Burkholderia territorii TaxID=1503055 RepID=A0A119VNZ8_9BURK|nr:hypothetical protein WT83_04945 [Burkholderia territorii]